MEEENKIKGGVIIMGSLRWETEDNAINNTESKALAEKRKGWRETYLDLAKEENPQLPIRYGRSSSSRKCTYTMVFSREALNKESFGLAIPYKNEIDFSSYEHFERQAKILADIEGISKNDDDRLRKQWGCIGIYINPDSKHSSTIENYWDALRLTDTEYTKSADHYNPNSDPPLIDNDYCLRNDVKIETKIDFLFFTYIRVDHRELDHERKPKREYPTPKEIAKEIKRSGYSTYYEENKKSRIRTYEDKDIDKFLP